MLVHQSPHLSLWKSAAGEVLAKQSGTALAEVGDDHPMMQGINHYANSMARGERLEHPGGGDVGYNEDDPQVLAYLSMLQHQAVHAKIQKDTDWQAEIDLQRSRFKFGNPLWEQQWIQYFEYYWDYPYHKGEAPLYRSWQDPKWGAGNPDYGVVEWRIPADATIALIGDIGTGTDIAASVLASALGFKPDLILHVGDIYYSGTPFEFKHRFVGMYEEVSRAVGVKVPMFTIPGNHEYFMGAKGFFQCLDSNNLIQHSKQQQEASYFALRTEDDYWQFLAMDTSYYGHYMEVSPTIQKAALDLLHNGKVDMPLDPTDPHWPQQFNPHFQDTDAHRAVHDTSTKPKMVTVRKDEADWHHQKLQSFSGRTVLLSHHQLYSATQEVGANPQGKNDLTRPYLNYSLWQQFGKYLDDDVAAWFWGHEHNLGIYANNFHPKDWPDLARPSPLAKGRCVGHAAIPVQESESPYKAKFPVPLVDGSPKLSVSNGWYNRGYQIMQLQGKNKPMQVTYYEIDQGDPTPIKLYEEEIS